MKMKDALAAISNAAFDSGFFDIHVEGIEQQPEIVSADTINKFQSLRDCVDQRGLITVDRLQGQANTVRAGSLATLAKGMRPASPWPGRNPHLV